MANFALGLKLGSEVGSQFTHNVIAAREEARRQEEYDKQKQYEADLANAGQTADVSTINNGLQVTSPTGQKFYVPTREAADAYAQNGYSVRDTPSTYQEVNVGSRGLGQYAGTEDPNVSVTARDYNAGRLERMQQVAERRGKVQDAAAYGTLAMQPLQREHMRLQNDLIPGQKELQGFQLSEAARTQRHGDVADKFYNAILGGRQGLIDFYAGEMPDGYTAKVVPDKKGSGFKLVQVDADGKEAGVIGAFTDDKHLQLEAMKRAPALISKALELQEKGDEKELWAKTQENVARINAGAKSTYVPKYGQPGATLSDGTPVQFSQDGSPAINSITGKPLSAAQQVELTAKLKGGGAGQSVTITKTDDGMIATSRGSGEPLYHISATGAKLPLGMKDDDVRQAVTLADKQGVKANTMLMPDGRIGMGYASADGRIFDNLTEAVAANKRAADVKGVGLQNMGAVNRTYSAMDDRAIDDLAVQTPTRHPRNQADVMRNAAITAAKKEKERRSREYD